MALTADRDTASRRGEQLSVPVYQAVTIYAGALVSRNASGYLVPVTAVTTLTGAYRATETVDNSAGSSGDVSCLVETGVFRYDNGDTITISSIGDAAYGYDDETVYKTGTGLSVVGKIVDVDSEGVWVDTRPAAFASGLAAANNLSEVTAATARTNLGLTNKHVVQATVPIGSLAGAGAFRALVVAPVAGTISKIYSVLTGHALATGDATLTAKINGTSVTTGVITITQSGSAIGDKDSCTPSALNTVAAGDVLEVLVGGTNDNTACGVVVTFEITEG